MKVLLIGLDGCHKEVFERGWTPFISSLLKSKRHLDIDNDLISRGWLEITLGQHASETTALYDKPKANGTLEWTNEFSLHDVPELGTKVKPLWQKLNEKGASVGIVNVPTTFPAPEVNGFFISGGGGGAPVTEVANEALCYPTDILPILEENGYIVDDRLYQLVVGKNLDTPEKILNRLAYKNERRTETFLALDKKFKVDFGFVVYKTASVVTETLLNAEYCRRRNEQNSHDDSVVEAVREYYENFDLQIKKLSETYPEAEFMFVSDHGTTERTHTVNPNILLQNHGFQYVDNKKNITKNAISKFKAIVPFQLKFLLKKTVSKKIQKLGSTNFNSEKTSAFCITTGDWCHGIYINDKARFGGPIADAEFNSIRDQIVDIINAHPDAIAHGIVAKSSSGATGKKLRHFPDIQLSLPNGYLTFDKGREFISEFLPPICKSSLESIMRGDILYMKSHTPLSYMHEKTYNSFRPEQLRGNLTVMHHRIVDMFDV